VPKVELMMTTAQETIGVSSLLILLCHKAAGDGVINAILCSMVPEIRILDALLVEHMKITAVEIIIWLMQKHLTKHLKSRCLLQPLFK
jgi:hypothetical protein